MKNDLGIKLVESYQVESSARTLLFFREGIGRLDIRRMTYDLGMGKSRRDFFDVSSD